MSKKWTKEEEDFVFKMQYSVTQEELAEKLNRSVSAINNKIHRLNFLEAKTRMDKAAIKQKIKQAKLTALENSQKTFWQKLKELFA